MMSSSLCTWTLNAVRSSTSTLTYVGFIIARECFQMEPSVVITPSPMSGLKTKFLEGLTPKDSKSVAKTAWNSDVVVVPS